MAKRALVRRTTPHPQKGKTGIRESQISHAIELRGKGWKYDDIAEMLGIPRGTLYGEISRRRERAQDKRWAEVQV